MIIQEMMLCIKVVKIDRVLSQNLTKTMLYVYRTNGHLVAVWQGRHEFDKRRVVLIEPSDVVGVDEAAGGTGQVDAGDAVSGALEQAC